MGLKRTGVARRRPGPSQAHLCSQTGYGGHGCDWLGPAVRAPELHRDWLGPGRSPLTGVHHRTALHVLEPIACMKPSIARVIAKAGSGGLRGSWTVVDWHGCTPMGWARCGSRMLARGLDRRRLACGPARALPIQRRHGGTSTTCAIRKHLDGISRIRLSTCLRQDSPRVVVNGQQYFCFFLITCSKLHNFTSSSYMYALPNVARSRSTISIDGPTHSTCEVYRCIDIHSHSKNIFIDAYTFSCVLMCVCPLPQSPTRWVGWHSRA